MAKVQIAPSPAAIRSLFEFRHFLVISASSFVIHVLTFCVRVYQLTLSPAQTFLFGAGCGCRFTPTCSVYAIGALREHGAVAGTALAAKRICRCHPWGECGHDPVPERGKRKAESAHILDPAQS